MSCAPIVSWSAGIGPGGMPSAALLLDLTSRAFIYNGPIYIRTLSNPIQYSMFLWMYYAWVISEVLGAWAIPKLGARRHGPSAGGERTRRVDRGSSVILFLGMFVSISLGFIFADAGLALLPHWSFYPGILLMAAGISLRQWSIATLGRFFSLTVRVAADHAVVDEGPYRFIRHPSYAGTLLTLAGLSLAVGSWGALLVLVAAFGATYYYRIRVEEDVLKAELGQAYLEYMRRVRWRLIPFLL